MRRNIPQRGTLSGLVKLTGHTRNDILGGIPPALKWPSGRCVYKGLRSPSPEFSTVKLPPNCDCSARDNFRGDSCPETALLIDRTALLDLETEHRPLLRVFSSAGSQIRCCFCWQYLCYSLSAVSCTSSAELSRTAVPF